MRLGVYNMLNFLLAYLIVIKMVYNFPPCEGSHLISAI